LRAPNHLLLEAQVQKKRSDREVGVVKEMVRQHSSSSWLLISRQVGGSPIIASLNQSDAEYIEYRTRSEFVPKE
jgi:hypothetical protein